MHESSDDKPKETRSPASSGAKETLSPAGVAGGEKTNPEPSNVKPLPKFAPFTDAQLRNRFSYHAPKGDQLARYGAIRAMQLQFAELIRELTPVSPEQTRAMNALDEVGFLANAAIARNE